MPGSRANPFPDASLLECARSEISSVVRAKPEAGSTRSSPSLAREPRSWSLRPSVDSNGLALERPTGLQVNQREYVANLDVSFVLGSLFWREIALVALLRKFCHASFVRFAECELLKHKPSCIRREAVFFRGDNPRPDSNFAARRFSLCMHDLSPPTARKTSLPQLLQFLKSEDSRTP